METNFRLEKMATNYIPEVVKLHLSLFAGDYPSSSSEIFFNNMGKKYLTLFLMEFCKHNFNYGVVAIEKSSNRVIGYSLMSSDLEKQYAYFYSKNFLFITLIFLYKILTNPVIRCAARKKIGSIKRALSSVLNKKSLSNKELIKQNSGYIMYTAVDKEFRRAGLSTAMMYFMVQELKNKGIKYVHCFVNIRNIARIKFYEKYGWKIVKKESNGIVFGTEL